jgi:hypothetical protein
MNENGWYNAPLDPKGGYRFVLSLIWMNRDPNINISFFIYSGEMYKASIEEFEWPNGTYWAKAGKK